MLAIVLVVEHHLDPAQGLLQTGTVQAWGIGAVVGPLAPVQKGLAEVGSGVPGTTVDQRLQTRSIGTGGGSIDAALGAQLTGDLGQGLSSSGSSRAATIAWA